MDDLLAINTAKSELRDAFNSGDIDRLLAVADTELVTFVDKQPCGFPDGGLEPARVRLESFFESFKVKLAVIAVEIRIEGDVAHGYGWHDLTLTPKQGGPPVSRRTRFMDVWRRDHQGAWKLWMYIDNQDME